MPIAAVQDLGVPLAPGNLARLDASDGASRREQRAGRGDAGRVRWRRRLRLALTALALVASVLFALRSYWSYELLRSAYAVGVPALSNVRGWMTLREVADTYNVPAPALTQQLNLPEQTDSGSTLRSLAEREGTSPIDYVQRVQQAVAAAAPAVGAGGVVNRSGWFTSVGDRLAAGLRAYGYPVLAAALLLGAFGVPLPNGLLAALAGALAAKGELSLLWAGVVAVSMSVCGDMAGFGLGRALGNLQFAPWTRWLGFTPARSSRLQQILARNGVLTVLVSRTLVSGISSLLNLIAGAAGYGLYRFLALTVVGRVFWTGAYLGAGYAVGGELDNANRLLQNLTGVMVATVLALILIRMEIRQRRTMV